MTGPVRIGNMSGFYGDRFAAMREMLTGGPLDVLTGDYLAELTMLILGRDRLRDPARGYARTFLRQLEECLGLAVDRGVRIVVNAGGLNPAGLAGAIRELAAKLALTVQVGHVEGDDLRERSVELGLAGEPPLTANAYLGCWGIVECLRGGADIVVTGRVTDAALVAGPAAWHHGWARDDWDPLAGATVAGHVLECGAQATGGNFAFFTEISGLEHPGFPLAEVSSDGTSVITKHPGTGGAVTPETVTAQLLYEIGPPGYLGPDVTSRFDTIELTADGPDRVRISGVRGLPPPPTVKVGLNRLGGFRNSMTFVLTGLAVPAKAELVQTQLTAALGATGPSSLVWTLARTDQPDPATEETASALLHVVARDPDPAKVGRAFSQAVVELALASYPGFFATSPPADGSPYGVFEAAQIAASEVDHVAVLPSGERVPVPPSPAASWTIESTDGTVSAGAAGGAADGGAPVSAASGPGGRRNRLTGRAGSAPGGRAGSGPGGAAGSAPVGPATGAPSGPSAGAAADGPAGGDSRPGAGGPAGPDTGPAGRDSAIGEAAGEGTGTGPAGAPPAGRGAAPGGGPVRRVPLGLLVGARSGDKGGAANLGVWARSAAAYPWLVETLTVERLRALLPEAADHPVTRYLLPNLNALNFVIDGLLGVGVAASTRFDPQAKGLGEWLRARLIDVPLSLVDRHVV
jgi:hypothetical protein